MKEPEPPPMDVLSSRHHPPKSPFQIPRLSMDGGTIAIVGVGRCLLVGSLRPVADTDVQIALSDRVNGLARAAFHALVTGLPHISWRVWDTATPTGFSIGHSARNTGFTIGGDDTGFMINVNDAGFSISTHAGFILEQNLRNLANAIACLQTRSCVIKRLSVHFVQPLWYGERGEADQCPSLVPTIEKNRAGVG